MVKHILSRQALPFAALLVCSTMAFAQRPIVPAPPSPAPENVATPTGGANKASTGVPLVMDALSDPSLLYKVEGPYSRMEMTVHSTRIFSMEQPILQAQVHNENVLTVTPLSPNQIQVSAKATGVTQVNLWGQDQKIHTVHVMVIADVEELTTILRASFPLCALKIVPVKDAVMISGYIDKPEYSTLIIRIAEEYYPKVINAMTVGGVEQVLLHIKVMEVSRTKMRKLGFDFAQVGSGGSLLSSGASGFLSGSVNTAASPMVSAATGNITTATNDVTFGIVNGANAFLGVLRCLRQDNLLKINSEPDLVAISGEEARFNAGGQIPVPVPQSLGTTTIEWKNYGTMIKFVPIVLGNGKIRMDVNPEISDLDASRSYTFNGTTVPGIRTRFARTSVEMVAGQTLAIAGLVQYYSESFNYGLPWVSEIPYVGTLFRNVRNETNEIELLVLVTPELVESLDPNEVPLCGPGTYTTDPSDWELFAKGHIEVPKCCPNKNGNGQAPADGMIGSPNSPGQNPADSGDAKGTGSYNRNTPSNPNRAQPSSASTARDNPPGFIGPAGYDVVK